MNSRVIASGAGFAGDRMEPAVKLAASGQVDAVALECLAERTIVPGLRARNADPNKGYDGRLPRRLLPLLPVARANGVSVLSNMGAANPAGAARRAAELARELGLTGMRIAAVVGDDVLAAKQHIRWDEPIAGELIGAHAYIGAEAMQPAVAGNADLILTGRAADSALFSAPVMQLLDGSLDALAGATAVGHLLECTGQVTGGNFEMPDGSSLSAAEFADLGFPLARVFADGSAEISMLDDAPGRIDALTCTLQLLYEVHDPSAYLTPDVTLDFTHVQFEELAPKRVRMTGVRGRARPERLKVSGFVESPGLIADVEVGYAGTHALQRGQIAADVLRMRLSDWNEEDIRIDLVGVDSTLGASSLPVPNRLPEVRLHVSARCEDLEAAQIVEDEIYALSLSGPAGAGSMRCEKRPALAVVDGFINREHAPTEVIWETVA